jgi:ribose transport system permease protein
VSVIGSVSRVPAPESPLGARARAVLGATELKRVLVLVVIVAVFTQLNPAFLRPASLYAVVQAMAFAGIVAVGQTLLIIAGEFDLSVGSTAALSSIVAALLMKQEGLDPTLSMVIGIAVGGLVGLVNATLVLRARIPSFIATIAMLGMARGLATWMCSARPVFNLPLTQYTSLDAAVSFSVVTLVALIVVGHLLVRRTNFGRIICATGGNAEAARIAGVKTLRVKSILFITSGLLAGLSGIFAIIHFGSSTITTGSGWELSAVAAVVVGGTSLFGGGGTLIGTLLGLSILQTITSGLVVVHIDPWWQTVVIGAIMLGSVSVDSVRRRAAPA